MDDVELTTISRTEYIHSDDHLLGALRRYKELWTYPRASDRGQVALHLRLQALQARGLVKVVKTGGNTVTWRLVV